MLINNFINQLADQLGIAISQNENGFASLSLDDVLVDIQSYREHLVFYSYIDHFSEQTFEREQQIKQAMSWTYGWQNSDSAIALISGRHAVQTTIALNDSFDTLLATLNSHCQLVAQISQLELQPIQHSQQHAYILP